MIVKRVVKFNIKKNHVDYNYIKQQLIESKEIYNYANYIIRQIFFKKSKNNKYNMDFVDKYPELKALFTKYIEEDKQFTGLFCRIIRKFAKLNEFSINSKIVQDIVRKLNSDWNSYWALLKLVKNKQYDKQIQDFFDGLQMLHDENIMLSSDIQEIFDKINNNKDLFYNDSSLVIRGG